VTETTPARTTDSIEKSLFQLSRELELLISAGLVFALLQLPAVLDGWWARNYIHVDGPPFVTVFIIYYVGKLIAYGLIVAIASHFLLRGFWVAIMGLRSVFPEGVDRAKLDQGTIFTTFYAERLMTLDELESRVDRFAASIFGFVFLFLLTFLILVVWATLGWVIAVIASRITGSDAVFVPVLLGIFLIFMGVQSFVASVDRTTKKRPVSPRTERVALRVMKWVYYGTFNFLYAPVFFTFATHTSRRKMNALLIAFMYTMILFFMLSIFASRGILGFDSYVFYPAQARPHKLRAVHYDNLRDADAPTTDPTIQSDVVHGPYLRLFIPYDAREDNDRLRALCPGLAPLRREGMFLSARGKLPDARVAELAGCFDKLYQIALDGKPVQRPGFVFYRHPSGNIPGRLAMLPVNALAPGKHMLTVRHTPLPGGKKDERADEFYIPFWR
jgi:hypothetical protein